MCWKALAILLMEMMWGNSPSSASSPPWMRTPPMVETISRLSRRREKVILEPGSNILDKRWEVTDVKGLVIICTLHTIYICHCKQKQVTKVLCFWHLFQTNNRYISCSPYNSQLSFILSHFTTSQSITTLWEQKRAVQRSPLGACVEERWEGGAGIAQLHVGQHLQKTRLSGFGSILKHSWY